MIVDTSAIVAVVFREPGFERIVERLVKAPSLAAGAPTLAEASIVVSARLKRSGRGIVERFLQELGIESIPFSD